MMIVRDLKNIYAIVALCIFVAMTVPAAHAEDAPNEFVVAISDTGMEAASALATMVYFPAKIAVTMGGGIVGLGAYLLTGGDDEAANEIWAVTNGGDFLVEPEHLTGEKSIKFMGGGETASAGH
ncbi:MAG: hypothetical protein CMH70_06225 [Nitrosomonadaceae bacterium]|nr:hypothetical protein [Nitrosomonadaceae bacterium]|tara:strand:- start:12463 stop:12834 length:372 start_codon:yes stop_codon:yes gene_type:complete